MEYLDRRTKDEQDAEDYAAVFQEDKKFVKARYLDGKFKARREMIKYIGRRLIDSGGAREDPDWDVGLLEDLIKEFL